MDATSAAQGLRAKAVHEIEAGGYAWRIRRVPQKDLSVADHATLMVFSREAMAAAPTQEEAVTRVQRMTSREIEYLHAAGMALLCAAVVAFRELPDGEWIPCRITSDEDAPPVDEEGRALLPAWALPAGVEMLLTREARTWAAGGAEGEATLRTFRDGAAGGEATATPAGEGVRDPALRVVAGM